jgi:hypothetical protein
MSSIKKYSFFPEIFTDKGLKEFCRIHRWLGFLIPVAILLHLLKFYHEKQIQDFASYYAAGHLMRTGALYDVSAYLDFYRSLIPGLAGKVLQMYVYPPSFALVLWPLALLRYAEAYMLWAAFSCLALFVLGRQLKYLATLSGQPSAFQCFYQTLPFGLIVAFFIIFNGQVSILLAILYAGFLIGKGTGRIKYASLLLALLLNIKPHLFIPLLIYEAGNRQWKSLAYVTLYGALFFLLSTVILGLQPWEDYVGLLQSANAGHVAGANFDNMVNLRAGLTRLSANNQNTVSIIIFALYFIYCASIFCMPRQVDKNRSGFIWYALILSPGFLLSPWLHSHDLIVLLPAAVLLVPALRACGKAYWLCLCYIMLSYANCLTQPLNIFETVWRLNSSAALIILAYLSCYLMISEIKNRRICSGSINNT